MGLPPPGCIPDRGLIRKNWRAGEVAVPTVLLGLRDRRVPVQPAVGTHRAVSDRRGPHEGEPARGGRQLHPAGADQRGTFQPLEYSPG